MTLPLGAPASPAPAGAGRARARALGAVPRGAGPSLAGAVALLLALAPLAGWGAGSSALAGALPGWPVVAPLTALGLLLAAVGTLTQGAAAPGVRRIGSACCGLLLVGLALLALLVLPAPDPGVDAAAAVDGWHADPDLLLAVRPSPFTAAALGLLGGALLLLAPARVGATSAAWLLAGGVALLALVTAGLPPGATPAPAGLEAAMAAAMEAPAPAADPAPELSALGDAAPPVLVDVGAVSRPAPLPMPPAVSVTLLLLASGVLLVRARQGEWWVPGRPATTRIARVMLPGVLVLLPTVVWLRELLVRRQRLSIDDGPALLATALVSAVAALVGYALWRAARGEEEDRERSARRVQRHARLEADEAAQRADRTLREATERYRAHLRGILEEAPTPFVAVDRDGYVAYVNAAAAELLGRPAERSTGLPLWQLWPELGPELRGALGAATTGRALRQTLVSASTGRAYELRGYPDDAGAALFVREVP